MDINNMPVNEEPVQEEKGKSGIIVSIIISMAIILVILILIAGATMLFVGKDIRINVKRDENETVELFLKAVFDLEGETLVDCMFPEEMMHSVYNASKEEYVTAYSDPDFSYEDYRELLAEALSMSLAWQMENVNAEIQNIEIVSQKQYGQKELVEYTETLLEQINTPDLSLEVTEVCEATVRYQLKETKDSQWEQAEKIITLYECDGCWYVDPKAVLGE